MNLRRKHWDQGSAEWGGSAWWRSGGNQGQAAGLTLAPPPPGCPPAAHTDQIEYVCTPEHGVGMCLCLCVPICVHMCVCVYVNVCSLVCVSMCERTCGCDVSVYTRPGQQSSLAVVVLAACPGQWSRPVRFWQLCRVRTDPSCWDDIPQVTCVSGLAAGPLISKRTPQPLPRYLLRPSTPVFGLQCCGLWVALWNSGPLGSAWGRPTPSPPCLDGGCWRLGSAQPELPGQDAPKPGAVQGGQEPVGIVATSWGV